MRYPEATYTTKKEVKDTTGVDLSNLAAKQILLL